MPTKYDKFWREIPETTPVELPIGYNTPEPLEQMIIRLVRHESQRAAKQDKETFEESDDFDDEDHDVISDHQFTDMQEEELATNGRYQKETLSAQMRNMPPVEKDKKAVEPPKDPAELPEKSKLP